MKAQRHGTQYSKWPGKPIPIPKEYLQRVRNPVAGRWCMMMYEFCSVMDSDEVVLLSFLLHHQELVSADLPKQYREAGWFWCMAETVRRYLGWDVAKQGRVLRKLKQRGYVQCEQHRKRNPTGLPIGQPVRWLRIEIGLIVSDIEEAQENLVGLDTESV